MPTTLEDIINTQKLRQLTDSTRVQNISDAAYVAVEQTARAQQENGACSDCEASTDICEQCRTHHARRVRKKQGVTK